MTLVAPAPKLIEDKSVYPTMVELAACLDVEMQNAGFNLCFCSIVPGAETVIEFCGGGGACEGDGECGGMAWVRLVTGYPSADGISPLQNANCSTAMAWVLEVGASTCAPMGGDDGSPPDTAAQLAATRRQLAQTAAMKRAIQCCFGSGDTSYILGEYLPLPILGGCLAGTWTVYTEGWQG